MLTETAKKVLEEVAKVIARKRTSFHMGAWHGVYRDGHLEDQEGTLSELRTPREKGCKTTHCIAGRIQVMYAKGRERDVPAYTFAVEHLGLCHKEAVLLFYKQYWPEPWNMAESSDGKAAAARIRHFIKTDGRE